MNVDLNELYKNNMFASNNLLTDEGRLNEEENHTFRSGIQQSALMASGTKSQE